PDLVLSPPGDDGRYVLKDPHTGAYFQLGAEEHFLLTQLDGRRTAAEIGRAYRERFGETLAEADLDEFLGLVRAQGFLHEPSRERERPEPSGRSRARLAELLYWRKAVFDPDRLFNRL